MRKTLVEISQFEISLPAAFGTFLKAVLVVIHISSTLCDFFY